MPIVDANHVEGSSSHRDFYRDDEQGVRDREQRSSLLTLMQHCHKFGRRIRSGYCCIRHQDRSQGPLPRSLVLIAVTPMTAPMYPSLVFYGFWYIDRSDHGERAGGQNIVRVSKATRKRTRGAFKRLLRESSFLSLAILGTFE